MITIGEEECIWKGGIDHGWVRTDYGYENDGKYATGVIWQIKDLTSIIRHQPVSNAATKAGSRSRPVTSPFCPGSASSTAPGSIRLRGCWGGRHNGPRSSPV